MKCPIHNEDLIEEWVDNKRFGFCQKCFKKYERCSYIEYMNSCNLEKCHKGPHLDSSNNKMK